MARLTPADQDDTLALSQASLTAAGQATAWTHFSGRFNLHITGSFTGSLVVDRSMDGGLTWAACTSLGAAVSFSAPASEVLEAGEAGTLYRVRAVTLTAGSALARLSQ